MKKIRNKILLLLLTTSSLFILLIGIYSLLSISKTNEKQTLTIKETLTSDYDDKIKSEVETAITIVNFYYESFKEGKMTEAEAQDTAKAAVKALLYNEDGYFWIDDTDGNLIAHPVQPENEGDNRIDLQDPNGVYLIREIISAAQENKNEGFTDYMWVKPEDVDTEKLSPKRAYSMIFEQWNWVVSTGNYIDDIDKTVAVKEAELKENFQKNEISIIGFLLLSLVGNTIFGIVLSRIISKPIISLVKGFEKDESGRITIQEINIKSKDEIGLLAKTLNEMSIQVKEFIYGVVKESEHVADSANVVKKDMTILNDEVEEISSTTEEIAAGMEETTAISEDLSSKAVDISDSAISIAKKADEASKAVGEISERAETLKANFNIAVDNGSKFLVDANDRLKQALEDSKAVTQISVLAEAIIEITEQTNLLALNASIEAARAGESGRGFAIIAEEIRQLADNSQDTVNQIQSMIQSVTSSVNSLYDNSSDLVNYMTQNVKSDYDLMLKASDEYNKDAKSLAGIISDFQSKAGSLSLTIQDMTKAMNEIASATAEGADGASDIANSIDLVTQKSSELLLQANESEQYSKSLLDLVSRFNI
jgi:methyl-accepting chemotaxis protein